MSSIGKNQGGGMSFFVRFHLLSRELWISLFIYFKNDSVNKVYEEIAVS